VFSLTAVEMRLLASQCQSVHLFAYNNSRRVERIFVNYDTEAFYYTLYKFELWLVKESNMTLTALSGEINIDRDDSVSHYVTVSNPA
jgi:hypothetical protein